MTKDKVDRRRVVTEERREFMRKIRIMGLEKRRANRDLKLHAKVELKRSHAQEERLLKKLEDVVRLFTDYINRTERKTDASKISGYQGPTETITTPQNSSPIDDLEYS